VGVGDAVVGMTVEAAQYIRWKCGNVADRRSVSKRE